MAVVIRENEAYEIMKALELAGKYEHSYTAIDHVLERLYEELGVY